MASKCQTLFGFQMVTLNMWLKWLQNHLNNKQTFARYSDESSICVFQILNRPLYWPAKLFWFVPCEDELELVAGILTWTALSRWNPRIFSLDDKAKFCKTWNIIWVLGWTSGLRIEKSQTGFCPATLSILWFFYRSMLVSQPYFLSPVWNRIF